VQHLISLLILPESLRLRLGLPGEKPDNKGLGKVAKFMAGLKQASLGTLPTEPKVREMGTITPLSLRRNGGK
jgi:hypothetical protein